MQQLSSVPHAGPFRFRAERRDVVAHEAWRRARDAALAALDRGEPVCVHGPPGTGKTLLLQTLAEILRERGVAAVFVGHGGEIPSGTAVPLVDEPGPELLTALLGRGGAFVVAGSAALQTALAGRRVAEVTLGPLSIEEVARFVAARLAAAGRLPTLLEPEAVLAVARHSGGLVRLVLVLAGAALFLAEQEGAPGVARRHVELAASLREAAEEEAPEPAMKPRIRGRRPVAVGALLCAMALAGGLAAASHWNRPARIVVAPMQAELPRQIPSPGPAEQVPTARGVPAPTAVAQDPAPPREKPARTAAAIGAPPPSVVPQAPASTVLSYRGPVVNETMGQAGQLALTITRQDGSDAVTIRFQASDGLVGAGELHGTLAADGRIVAEGRLMMGRNAFDCSLEGRLDGGAITGAATFVRVGQAYTARSRFNLARA